MMSLINQGFFLDQSDHFFQRSWPIGKLRAPFPVLCSSFYAAIGGGGRGERVAAVKCWVFFFLLVGGQALRDVNSNPPYVVATWTKFEGGWNIGRTKGRSADVARVAVDDDGWGFWLMSSSLSMTCSWSFLFSWLCYLSEVQEVVV